MLRFGHPLVNMGIVPPGVKGTEMDEDLEEKKIFF
jgi:hypothetical protein